MCGVYTQTRDPLSPVTACATSVEILRAWTLAVVLILISSTGYILLYEGPCGNRIVPELFHAADSNPRSSVLEPRPPLTRDP
ncbi:MAG: hypothetical protein H6Q55_129 [Deltaproteobacteria bacterium]|nr:hypothetical protein [Deltaproteobacteria bacterium]